MNVPGLRSKHVRKLIILAGVLALIPIVFPGLIFAAPSFADIATKGDRNLKIISYIYEKYEFMPAKREYFQNISEEWIKGKVLYEHSSAEEKKDNYEKLYKSYRTTNDVLKDISIDLANLSEAVVDDFSQKIIESEDVRKNLSRDKNYNRFVVSRNEFTRADNGFKRGMYYYSARLYDHGLDLMKRVYKDQKWVFPKSKAPGKATKEGLS